MSVGVEEITWNRDVEHRINKFKIRGDIVQDERAFEFETLMEWIHIIKVK